MKLFLFALYLIFIVIFSLYTAHYFKEQEFITGILGLCLIAFVIISSGWILLDKK